MEKGKSFNNVAVTMRYLHGKKINLNCNVNGIHKYWFEMDDGTTNSVSDMFIGKTFKIKWNRKINIQGWMKNSKQMLT